MPARQFRQWTYYLTTESGVRKIGIPILSSLKIEIGKLLLELAESNAAVPIPDYQILN